MKEDILNRDEFVERVFTIIEGIAQSSIDTNVSFAINGEWGCGKTFVLDMLVDKLSAFQAEDSADNKYFVVRYNCWQYDFYDEPIIAIVAAILASIREQTSLIGENTSEKVHKAFDVVKGILLKIGEGIVKEKFGVDVSETVSIIKETIEDADGKSQKHKDEKHDYDELFSFKAKLEELKKALGELAKVKSIVLIVDELDRCIPSYAIKVLERLHHLTEGTPNIITILALDKTHLQSGIEKTIGIVDPEVYLRKFIQFDIGLNCGIISNRFAEKYKEYFDNFDSDLIAFEEPIDVYLSNLFKDIPIRTQEQIMQKVAIAHKLSVNQKMDYSFMCMELLIAVMIYQYHYPYDAFEKGLKRQDFSYFYNKYYDKDRFFDSIVITQGDYDSFRDSAGRISKTFTNGDIRSNISRKYPFSNLFVKEFTHLQIQMFSSSDDPTAYFSIRKNSYEKTNTRSLYEELLVKWCSIHNNSDFYLDDKRFCNNNGVYSILTENEYIPSLQKFILFIEIVR